MVCLPSSGRRGRYGQGTIEKWSVASAQDTVLVMINVRLVLVAGLWNVVATYSMIEERLT